MGLIHLFFYRLTRWTSTTLSILWTYRIIVISLLVMYLALWQMDQGMDLLVNLNDGDLGVIIFYLSISILAALHWHLAKYVSHVTDQNGVQIDYRKLSTGEIFRIVFNGNLRYGSELDSNVARMLGVLTLLIPGFGILNVLQEYGITSLPAGKMLLATMIGFGLLFKYNFFEKTSHHPTWRWIFIIGVIIILISIGVLRGLNHNQPEDLVWLCLGVCLLAVAFVIVVSIRRKVTNKILERKSVAPFVMWPAVLFMGFFVLLNVKPHLLASTASYGQFSSIWVLLSALTFYVLFFFFLAVMGRKTEINIAGFFVVFALLSAYFIDNTFHDIHRIKRQSAERISLEKYFLGWLSSRESEINHFDSLGSKYPLFLVNAYGGGIRAAAFTSLAIAHLDSAVRAESNGKTSFQHHVFSYSGASGGTVGAAVMCVLSNRNDVSENAVFTFYQRDFLSPVLVGLTGRDFMYATFGSFASFFGKMRDRARLQDSVWTLQLKDQFNSESFSGDFRNLWRDSSYRVPLLFANTYYVEKGEKGILSSVELDSNSFPTALLVNHFLDTTSLQLSSAAFISARFPFISPAGEMDPNHHFMDGGLKENSGAETSREIGQALENLLLKDTAFMKFRNKIQIEFLSLKNTTDSIQQKSPRNMFQLTAPLLALGTNWEGNTRRADALNELLYKGHYYRITPSPYVGKKKKVVFPLGWQISGAALLRLQTSLGENKNPQIVKQVTEKIMIDE